MGLFGLFRKAHPLEKVISYCFKNKGLLLLSLRHPSSVDDRTKSNQRLEFLGDAVLEVCVSRWLYRNYPFLDEGEMTEYRRRLVQRQYLAKSAERLNLFSFLDLGEAEKKLSGDSKAGVLADAYEALMGAIFLDSGPEKSLEIVERIHLVNPEPAFVSDEYRNYKGELLEYAQSKGLHPTYSIDNICGEKHSQTFSSSVRLKGIRIGVGEGSSKKSAEQAAARMALLNIEQKEQ